MIKRIKLNNFRQFEKLEIDTNAPLIIIFAENAQGKSTILEAISFITNQSSPFTSEITNLYKNDSTEEHLRIEMDNEHDGDTYTYALFQTPSKREFHKNQHKTTKKKFAEYLASTIFSPEMIELLMTSPDKRRTYLDQVLARINPDFNDLLIKQKKILKQRNAYLKKLAKKFYETGFIPDNDKQLDYWTDLYADVSSQIMVLRSEFMEKLRYNGSHVQYEPSLEISEIELMSDLENITDFHKLAMRESYKRDIAVGHTTIGAHRDDWSIHSDKDIRNTGSRGEKRLAISKLIFRCQELLAEYLGFFPTLLLDDISSELDIKNTTAILTDAAIDNQQVIVTAISLEGFPKEVVDKAKIIEL